MKVGTDGVLLGAWAAVSAAQWVLDVGTGTGLVSLMVAQRTPPTTRIDAVEIDPSASQQAWENGQRSPWADRLRVFEMSLQSYVETCEQRYDLLVANPPFFEESLPSPNPTRTLARHNASLTGRDLLNAADKLLLPTGELAVIYPPDIAERFLTQAAEIGLHCRRRLQVKPLADRPIKRVLLQLSRQPVEQCHNETLVLEQARHVYTPEFVALVRDFYLRY